MEAAFELGLQFVNGDDMEEDFEEAKKWWGPAAEQGYVQAIFGMAAICEEELDYNEAMKWYQILADADIDEAKAKVKELKNKVK
jgi:TPR repeat protein